MQLVCLLALCELAGSQFPCVRTLAFTDRPNLVGRSSNNRCGLPSERYKLDLVGFLPGINVNDYPTSPGSRP